MVRKTHITILCMVFVFANTGFGYLYDYKPELVSPDYRLAAMGNLDLVVRHWDNELNMYDFGESPAGLLDDNQGKSLLYLPGSYGFTAFDEDYDDNGDSDWHGYALSLLGITKKAARLAGGLFLAKQRSDNVYYSVWNMRTVESYYDNYSGLCVAAFRFSSQLVMGLQGEYDKQRRRYLIFGDEDWYERDSYLYKPAVLITSSQRSWQLGLNYSLTKIGPYTTAHYFAVPFLYNAPHVTLGVKGGLGPVPHHDDWRKSIEVQSLFHILTDRGSVDLGLLAMFESPRIHNDFDVSSSPGWETELGTGIAYSDKQFGVVGMQYKRIMTRYELTENYTVHENRISLGGEFLFSKVIPLRLGYVNVFYDHPYYEYPAYDILTSGFGVRIPGTELEVDFVYNSKIIRYSEYSQYWYDYYAYTNVDHLFGLSGRFFW